MSADEPEPTQARASSRKDPERHAGPLAPIESVPGRLHEPRERAAALRSGATDPENTTELR